MNAQTAMRAPCPVHSGERAAPPEPAREFHESASKREGQGPVGATKGAPTASEISAVHAALMRFARLSESLRCKGEPLRSASGCEISSALATAIGFRPCWHSDMVSLNEVLHEAQAASNAAAAAAKKRLAVVGDEISMNAAPRLDALERGESAWLFELDELAFAARLGRGGQGPRAGSLYTRSFADFEKLDTELSDLLARQEILQTAAAGFSKIAVEFRSLADVGDGGKQGACNGLPTGVAG